MRRFHDMPFGAQATEDGGFRFRLWAPAARSVGLSLESGGRKNVLPMAPVDEGWFEIVTDRARFGDLYRFVIDEKMYVPDPASRYQPGDVHGPSQLVDPLSYEWRDDEWRGRPWEEAVIYEAHVGAFTKEGTFAAAVEKLEHLAILGVTALELMPVGDFPGGRNWGYDGALIFAPDSAYGGPEDLKALVDAAHLRGLMVFLDVVYNHFGPEGNYLGAYAPAFFSTRHETLWGAGINFDGDGSRHVRGFFIHNALYWLEEYNLDGLRLDAVHAISDDSEPDFLTELARTVNARKAKDRHIHLALENDDNAARYLRRAADGRPELYTAQWNDDIHHALHVLATKESEGYYIDYADDSARRLGRCLTEGFAYQGEPSAYRHGARRGEQSKSLPPTAFVSFLQNHDQTGNRAMGERIVSLASPDAVRAAMAITLLAPSPPLFFMGQEWGADEPFLFFCDFEPGLAESVSEGRKNEFSRFPEFSSQSARERIPDPCAPDTFERSKLDWGSLDTPEGKEWLEFHKQLLDLRKREIVPRLRGVRGGESFYRLLDGRALEAGWILGDGSFLALFANMSGEKAGVDFHSEGALLFSIGAGMPEALSEGVAPPWSAAWFIGRGGRTRS